MHDSVIRVAVPSEQKSLEELERRAGLANPGDREAILAHPEVIEVPPEQIVSLDVFVLEMNGIVAGFAAVKPRLDGDTDLDGLFVESENAATRIRATAGRALCPDRPRAKLAIPLRHRQPSRRGVL